MEQLYTLSTDPLLVLMGKECDGDEDELREVQALADERESVLMAAQFIVSTHIT